MLPPSVWGAAKAAVGGARRPGPRAITPEDTAGRLWLADGGEIGAIRGKACMMNKCTT
jgi:hypothetical protein